MNQTKRSQAGRGLRKWLLIAALGATLVSGCQTAAGTGALTGAAAGGTIGALAGRCPGAAVVGAAVGAVAGTVVGSAVDQDHAIKQAKAAAADTAARAPTLEQIAQMVHDGVSDTLIINQIRTANVAYRLSTDHIVWLKQNNVSDAVISEMQATNSYHPRQVVYVSAPPPPPVAVGIGVGIR
jgi:hypothetical protein